MSIDPRTPVLVGVSAIVERPENPADAGEPLDLMERALRGAAADAGSEALLTEVDSIWATRGFWAYADPGRILATIVRTSFAPKRSARMRPGSA